MQSLEKQLPVIHLINLILKAELINFVVIGFRRFLGRKDPVVLLSDKYERQQVSLRSVYPERQTITLQFRQCPSRGCHRREYPHLAMFLYRDCHNLLFQHMALPAQPCRSTMLEIRRLGRSTLFLSVPDPKRADNAESLLFRHVLMHSYQHLS